MSEEKTKKCKYCKTEIPADAKVCPQCRKKLKGGKLKWVVLIILVGAIIGAVAGESDSESDKSAATATSSEKKETTTKQKEEAAPIEYTTVSVNDMMSDLDSNAMGASGKYKGKYLEITGNLSNIDASGNTSASQLTAILKSSAYSVILKTTSKNQRQHLLPKAIK